MTLVLYNGINDNIHNKTILEVVPCMVYHVESGEGGGRGASREGKGEGVSLLFQRTLSLKFIPNLPQGWLFRISLVPGSYS